MEESLPGEKVCAIIGASHAGVNVAFALRREGWQGRIYLIDQDPTLPYHRPHLSKSFLTQGTDIEQHALKPQESYIKEHINLVLGREALNLNPSAKSLTLDNGDTLTYDKLVLAMGARPFIPPISGIDQVNKVFPLRNAHDARNIRDTLYKLTSKRVLIIGGGFIGLETASSFRKLEAEVTVVEREDRLLSRVSSQQLSAFLQDLHAAHGVHIHTGKHVTDLIGVGKEIEVRCRDKSHYRVDMVVIGTGIQLNVELASSAGLVIENGIRVDSSLQTSHPDIYAIGDCTDHFNPHYNRFVRLESVQNAVDQAKVAAAAICGKNGVYNAIPWFWSDQYDVKLQIVGLSEGYDEVWERREPGEKSRLSLWYFKANRLLAVDAVNHPKAYVLGTKFIKEQKIIDKAHLIDPTIELHPSTLLKD